MQHWGGVMRTKLLRAITVVSVLMMTTIGKSETELKVNRAKVDLINGMYVSEPFDFLFESNGSRQYGLPGMGGRAGKIKEMLWTVKKENLSLYVYYYHIPGRRPKHQQTIEFIDQNNLSVINHHMKKYSADAAAAGSDPEKIANGDVRGYISTAEAKPGSEFTITFRQMYVGNYTCVTEAVLNRISQGTLAKKVDNFIAIIASNDCESSNHKKAIAAIKSITG